MEKTRIGILGCASVAQKYGIPAFQNIPNAEVTYIASRNKEKAKEWADKFSISSYGTYNDLLNSEYVDAVYIPLPIGLHEEWAIKSANAGKHIICEKSLSDTFESVNKIVNSCKNNNLALYENFMCDYHPQHQAVLNLASEGKIGKPFLFRSYFGFPPFPETSFRYDKQLGGGSLNDAGAYTAFMARKILSSEPTAVSCNLTNHPDKGIDTRGSALIEFPNEQSAILSFGFDNVYQNNYDLWGSKGLIRVGRAYSIPPNMKPDITLLSNENFKENLTQIDIPSANHFEIIFSDFCNTIINKDNNKIDHHYNSILAQARVLQAMRISSKEDRKVHIKEVL